MKTIKMGDFILITYPYENYYLKIGEVIKIDYDFDGIAIEYTVRFGYDYDTSEELLEFYRYDLPDLCRVLQFETQ